MNNKKLLIPTLAFMTIFSSALAVAEGRIGRLPDGRAYRTDSQGIQLVDQVADLELNVEELKRQLEAARNESSSCPTQPQFLCPEIDASEREVKRSQEEILALRAELDRSRSEVANAKISAEELVADSKKALGKTDQVIAARDKEISLLRAKLKIADEQIAYYKTAGIAAQSDGARASLSHARSGQSISYNIGQPRAEDEQKVRDEALNSFRKTIKVELNQVKELQLQRDQLFKMHADHGGALQIRPSVAFSSQNRGIEQLEKDISTESSMRMLGLMSRELREIREKINDDIQLVQRVGKL